MRRTLVLLALAGGSGALIWWAGRAPVQAPPGADAQRAHHRSQEGSQSRRKGRQNRLKNERSAYLRQHARNPVDWYPWGAEALQRAKAENKPIFLSIGYASCHWCHVMEKEVFEKEDVAQLLNRHFVNIKVDREERPDLDAVYMAAVQTMTGSGGWPMSVFLTPQLKPFFGGTYFPHPRFLALASRLARLFREKRETLEARAEGLYRHISSAPTLSSSGQLTSDDIATLVQSAKQRFDSKWGGFAGRMKFPTPSRWFFLLHAYRKHGAAETGPMVRLTLDQIGSGGIQDHIDGGFFRYTVEPTWVVPHFEKMLYDNAQLARLYTEAAAVFRAPRYDEIAHDTLDFLIRRMRGKRGEFFSSYDADSGGHEGTFYLWSPSEIGRAVGQVDGAALSAYLGITEQGNFEGKNIPTRRANLSVLTRKHLRNEAQFTELFQRKRPALRAYRAKRPWPSLDKKAVTGWNGMAIAAFAAAYRAYGTVRYLRVAREAAEFIWRVHRRPGGRLYRASNQGVAENEAVLDDYAFLADGLLELFIATQDLKYLQRVLALLVAVDRHFTHPRAGYYFTPEGHEAPMGRQVQVFDGVRPSGLAMLLRVQLAVAALRADERLRQRVERTVAAHSDRIRSAGLEMTLWFDVAQLLRGPYYEVVIAGPEADRRTAALVRAVHHLRPTHALLIRVPARGSAGPQQKLLPSTAGKRTMQGRPTAYVCRFGACKWPTGDPTVLTKQLLEGWRF